MVTFLSDRFTKLVYSSIGLVGGCERYISVKVTNISVKFTFYFHAAFQTK